MKEADFPFSSSFCWGWTDGLHGVNKAILFGSSQVLIFFSVPLESSKAKVTPWILAWASHFSLWQLHCWGKCYCVPSVTCRISLRDSWTFLENAYQKGQDEHLWCPQPRQWLLGLRSQIFLSVLCHKDSQSLNLILGPDPTWPWSLEPEVWSDPSWIQAVVVSSHILAGFLLRSKRVSVSCLLLSVETPQAASDF